MMFFGTNNISSNFANSTTLFDKYNLTFDRATDGNIISHHMLTKSINGSMTFFPSTDKIDVIFYRYTNTLYYMPYKSVLLCLYCLLLIGGTVINLLLIFTIQRLRNPKSLCNRRMLIIRVICDLALVWFVVPHTAYTAVYRNWQLGSKMCQVSAFTMYYIVALSNFLLMAICLNRTVAISQMDKSPNDPATNVPLRVKVLLALAFLLALVIALPGALVSEQVHLPLDQKFSKILQDMGYHIPTMCRETWSRKAQLTYDVVLIVTIYVIPLIVICLSQHVVTVHLRQSQRLHVLMGHRHTLAWTRKRQRLTRLCAFMAVLFVVSWLPNHVANLLVKTFHVNNEATEIVLDFAMWIALSNAVSGPLLLIATCSVYHRYLKRLVCRAFSHHRSNRSRYTSVTGPPSSVGSTINMYVLATQVDQTGINTSSHNGHTFQSV